MESVRRFTPKVEPDAPGFRWCGPADCAGAGQCPRCDESCAGRDRHAHADTASRAYVGGVNPKICYGPTCMLRCQQTPTGVRHDVRNHPPLAV